MKPAMRGDLRRTDTRERIQAVALELFAEQGYATTSLQAIAEHLGLTKAAVYYHFKTKEDIVGSLFEEFLHDLGEIIQWARDLPRTPEVRQEIIRRYAGMTERHGASRGLLQFLQQNQPTMRRLATGARLEQQVQVFLGLLTDPAASPAEQLRTRLSLLALHGGPALLGELGLSDAERRAAALDVALSLVGQARGTADS